MLRFYSDAIADLNRVQTPFVVAVPGLFIAGVPGIGADPAPSLVLLSAAPGAATAQPIAPSSTVQTLGRPVWLTCDFIERPFVQLTLAETLFEQAETEYKTDALADLTLPALPIVANEKPGDWPRQGFEFSTHGLRAAQSYLQIFDMFAGAGAYTERVLNGRDELAQGANDPNAAGFHAVGKNITLPAKESHTPTVQS